MPKSQNNLSPSSPTRPRARNICCESRPSTTSGSSPKAQIGLRSDRQSKGHTWQTWFVFLLRRRHWGAYWRSPLFQFLHDLHALGASQQIACRLDHRQGAAEEAVWESVAVVDNGRSDNWPRCFAVAGSETRVFDSKDGSSVWGWKYESGRPSGARASD